MYKLTNEERTKVVAALVEGNSIRSTARMTGIARNTITSLLVDLGAVCFDFMDKAMQNLTCSRIQCDEIWSFIYAKQKNVKNAKAAPQDAGDVWTWTAIDAETKLVPCFTVGPRDLVTATEFIRDLAGRVVNRVQLTTDGYKPYLEAVEGVFGAEIDYAMLIKLYGSDPRRDESRYSPATVTGIRKVEITGAPDPKHISTSYVERQNLSMRMGMRRFTRLTNGFSKKLENHVAALSLYFVHYNFARIHQTLRITPAMAAGVSDHAWEISEIVGLLDAVETKIAA